MGRDDDHDRYHYHEEPDGPVQWQFDEKTADTLRGIAERHEHTQWLKIETGSIFKIFVYVAGALITFKVVMVDWLWKLFVHVK